jgi:hypothetical protein
MYYNVAARKANVFIRLSKIDRDEFFFMTVPGNM